MPGRLQRDNHAGEFRLSYCCSDGSVPGGRSFCEPREARTREDSTLFNLVKSRNSSKNSNAVRIDRGDKIGLGLFRIIFRLTCFFNCDVDAKRAFIMELTTR